MLMVKEMELLQNTVDFPLILVHIFSISELCYSKSSDALEF